MSRIQEISQRSKEQILARLKMHIRILVLSINLALIQWNISKEMGIN